MRQKAAIELKKTYDLGEIMYKREFFESLFNTKKRKKKSQNKKEQKSHEDSEVGTMLLVRNWYAA